MGAAVGLPPCVAEAADALPSPLCGCVVPAPRPLVPHGCSHLPPLQGGHGEEAELDPRMLCSTELAGARDKQEPLQSLLPWKPLR